MGMLDWGEAKSSLNQSFLSWSAGGWNDGAGERVDGEVGFAGIIVEESCSSACVG